MAAAARAEVMLSADRPAGGWMVVQSNFRKEKVLKANLINQHYEVYLPMRLPQVINDRAEPKPLFPGIVLVRLTPSVERWQAIFSTQGFKSLFMARGRPIGLKDEFVSQLQGEEVEHFLQVGLLGRADTPAKKGGRWVPLGDLVHAILAETVDDRRNMLLASILSGDQRDTVDLSKLSRA
jgi:transcription antitermination factor NusG